MRDNRREDLAAPSRGRRPVPAAERHALDRSDQLRRRGGGILAEVTSIGAGEGAAQIAAHTAPVAGRSAHGDGLGSQVAALRSEAEAARTRAASHAEELARMRAEQHRLSRRLDRLQVAVDTLAAGPTVPGSPAVDAGAGQARGAAVEAPEADPDEVLAAAREAEELLSAAMTVVEREMARSAAIRAEAEQLRAEAVAEARRLRSDARAEADRILGGARAEAEAVRRRAREEGRADGRASLEEARRRLAEETAELRIAMDQTWSTLEKLVGPPEPQR